MSSYKIISLSRFLHQYPRETVSGILSSFLCERDKDVESFLKEKAIVQEIKQISRTYLMFTATGHEPVAYFTVAVNSMDGSSLECSKSLQKKMNIHNKIAHSYLIGQIGKRDGSEKGLGKFALDSAVELIMAVNSKVGCRVIRLDCKPSLKDYYESNGSIFAGRNRDNDLSQMISIIESHPLQKA